MCTDYQRLIKDYSRMACFFHVCSMTTEYAIGITASIFTGVSAIPQLLKLLKEKKSGNISFFMLMVLLTGLFLWSYYGILKKDWIIVCSNSFSFLVNLSIAILMIKNRRTLKSILK